MLGFSGFVRMSLFLSPPTKDSSCGLVRMSIFPFPPSNESFSEFIRLYADYVRPHPLYMNNIVDSFIRMSIILIRPFGLEFSKFVSLFVCLLYTENVVDLLVCLFITLYGKYFNCFPFKVNDYNKFLSASILLVNKIIEKWNIW